MTRVKHESQPVRWDDLKVSLRGASVGAAAPALTLFRDNGAGSTGVEAYAFSKTIDQSLHFDVQLPHSWVAGTGVRPHVHWSPGSSTNTGVVRWQLEYTWASAVTAPNTFPTTTLAVVDQAAAGAYGHQIAQFAEIAGTDQRLSSVLICRLSRLAASATQDTFDAVAFGLSVDFHIQVAGSGSVDEYPS